MYSRPDRFVIGIVIQDQAWAWGWDGLTQNPLRNVILGEEAAVVIFDQKNNSAQIFSRQSPEPATFGGHKLLTFSLDNDRMVDLETGSSWNPTTGEAIEGTLKGSKLKALPGIPSYRRTWETFYPDSKFE